MVEGVGGEKGTAARKKGGSARSLYLTEVGTLNARRLSWLVRTRGKGGERKKGEAKRGVCLWCVLDRGEGEGAGFKNLKMIEKDRSAATNSSTI